MSAKDAASVDSGLQSLRFHYMSMMILITIPKKDARNQTADSAQELLNLLPHLDSTTGNSRTSNSTILWQYMHFSLAAFGTLWGQIVMKGRAQRPSSEIEHLLCSIERLPEFLEALSARHHIARTLQSVTTRMVSMFTERVHLTTSSLSSMCIALLNSKMDKSSGKSHLMNDLLIFFLGTAY